MWSSSLIIWSMVTVIQGYWINYPSECKSIETDVALNKLCGGGDIINIRDKLLDNSYEKFGEICTPDNTKSRRVKGFYCVEVSKSTKCRVLENFDNEVTYRTEVRRVGRKECYNYIKTTAKERSESGDDRIAPFYLPPKCELGEGREINKKFMLIKERDINLNPLDFEREDLYLFKLKNHTIDEKDLLLERSEYCKFSNWKCHGKRNYIPLEIFKNDDQISLRLELIKLEMIYDSEYGEIPIYGSCKMHFCGKNVLRTKHGAIVHLSNSEWLNKVKDCKRDDIIKPIQDLSQKVFKTFGPVLLSTLYKRHELCKKIKENLKNSKSVPFENLNYINPFEPGWHPAAHYKKISSTVSGSFRGRVVQSAKLEFMNCLYEIGDLHKGTNISDSYILFNKGKRINLTDVKEREGWKKEDIDVNQNQNLTKTDIEVWYNGVIYRDGQMFFPTTFLISKFESLYKDKVLLSLEKSDSIWVDENGTEVRVVLIPKQSTENPQKANTDVIVPTSIENQAKVNNVKTFLANETILIENKSYFEEDFSTWSVYTILSVLGLWVLYKKGLNQKKKIVVRNFFKKFFKLDYRQSL
uniref:Non-structural transmembrane glycoprotein GNS n=1 Tax=Hefer Valley virus TaxID=3035973 RepID=A0AA49ET20_9RHAB|nr:non-structural transmembrane glycoprotein GNS [Hefer Valley virus]